MMAACTELLGFLFSWLRMILRGDLDRLRSALLVVGIVWLLMRFIRGVPHIFRAIFDTGSGTGSQPPLLVVGILVLLPMPLVVASCRAAMDSVRRANRCAPLAPLPLTPTPAAQSSPPYTKSVGGPADDRSRERLAEKRQKWEADAEAEAADRKSARAAGVSAPLPAAAGPVALVVLFAVSLIAWLWFAQKVQTKRGKKGRIKY